MASRLETAAIELLPYQKRWIEDRSRFKVWLKSRQIGGSFASTLDAVLACVEQKSRWVVLSRGERQAKALIEECATHAKAIGCVVTMEESTFWSQELEKEINQLEITFPNGSKIIGLPANPDTARGFSANVILDEFAFHQDSRKIWRALAPMITRGHRIVVLSTPNGMSNMFYEIWSGKTLRRDPWSRHETDIYRAKAEGFDVDIDELRDGINDPDGFSQEYECKFIDEATAYLTYEMITACEDDNASMEAETVPNTELFGGMDIGRKRDLSVIWLSQRVGDVSWTRVVKVMAKAPFRVQREALFGFIPSTRRFCIDATGSGAQLAEEAQERFGSYRVEAITFTGPVKEDLAVRMRTRFEDRLIRIPADREIREDLHSVKKFVTAAGNLRFDADRTEEGHADRFWAAALAELAASGSNAVAAEAVQETRDGRPMTARDYARPARRRASLMGFKRPGRSAREVVLESMEGGAE